MKSGMQKFKRIILQESRGKKMRTVNKVDSFTLTFKSPWAANGLSETFDINPSGESKMIQKNGYIKEQNTSVDIDIEKAQKIMKYVISQDVYKKLRKELDEGTSYMVIDGGFYSISFTLDKRIETYDLGTIQPNCILALDKKIRKILESV